MRLNSNALNYLLDNGQTMSSLSQYGFLEGGTNLTQLCLDWMIKSGWTEATLAEHGLIGDAPAKDPIEESAKRVPKHKPEVLVQRYFELKDLDDAEAKVLKEAHAARKAEMDECLDDSRLWLHELNVNSLNTAKGVAFLKDKDYVNLDDADALNKWYCEGIVAALSAAGIGFTYTDGTTLDVTDDLAIKTMLDVMLGAKMFGFLPKNVLKATVKAELKETEKLPPGVSYVVEKEIYINRNK